jgi:MYXO-CTERM domain-containing protein
MRTFIALATLSLVAGFAHAAGTVNLGSDGYAESFDAMGTAGTAPPTGWAVYTGNSGTSNSTWTSAITANGSNSVASMVATTGALTATSAPTTTANNGFNAARQPGATADRVLATSPTTVSGGALQLALVNTTGHAFDQLLLGYDTVRFTAVSSANELPGYQMFSSLDGSSWTHLAALDPSLATVPNTVGVSTVGATRVSLGGTVAQGATLYLRWVDDNARQTSPDQIIGLNNVTVSAMPEPGQAALWLAGLLGLAAFARRRA